MSAATCPACGSALDAHDRHWRCTLPDAVLALSEHGDVTGVWMDGEHAGASVMLQVPEAGAFLRAVLPVHLDDGGSMTFGVWISVSEEDLHGAFSLWWAPEYPRLRVTGRLANRIEPWGLLGAPVELRVLDPDALPYCVASDDAVLQTVLTEVQAAGPVLAATTGRPGEEEPVG